MGFPAPQEYQGSAVNSAFQVANQAAERMFGSRPNTIFSMKKTEMVQINSVSSSEPSARNHGSLWGQTLTWLPFVVNWSHTTNGIIKKSRSNMAETVKRSWEITILCSFSFFFSLPPMLGWHGLSFLSLLSTVFTSLMIILCDLFLLSSFIS